MLKRSNKKCELCVSWIGLTDWLVVIIGYWCVRGERTLRLLG